MPLRIFVLFFFLFSIWIDSFSQVDKSSPAIYDSVPGILLIKNDTVIYTIGIFKMGESLGGELLKLDSNMHFERKVYADVAGGGILDNGTWFWDNSGKLGLKSKSGLKTFDLIKYRHFYICVPQNQRGKFVKDLLNSQNQFKNIKPIHVGDSVYTADDLAVYSLMRKYYLHDLNEW